MKKFLKFLWAQKGQTLVLYALLVPLMFMVGGAGVDLGWYYFNKARLQNMADAAVIAGGKALVNENGELTNYTYNRFLAEVPEAITDIYERQTPIGDAEAKNYIVKNLSGTSNWNGNQIHDDSSNSELNFQRILHGIRYSEENPLYYEVILTEKHQHLFEMLNNYLDDTVITVNSVAELKYSPPPEDSPPTQDTAPEPISDNIPRLAAVSVVSGNWELEDGRINGKWKKENAEKELAKNPDNLFIQMSVNSIYPTDKVWLNYNSSTNSYTEGKFYRSATVYVNPGNGRYKTGSATTGTEHEEEGKNPDSITLGFRQDLIRVLPGYLEIQDGKIVRVKNGGDTIFEEDWDIRRDTPYNRKTEVRYINPTKFWDKSCDLRIHNIFNFDIPFDVRTNRDELVTKKDPYDVLWVRVESEAFIPLKMLGVNKANHVQYKSVRQIILNMNGDNTVKDENGNFKYRPVVMFYMGPEKIDMSSSVRTSKPVILNLNADFRGILFAPYSPVILNANGHKFYGFIVAKEYRKFTVNKNEGHKVKHNKSNEMYVNDYGEVFSERTDIEKCGDYDSFNIMSFEDYGYQVADEEPSQNNLLIYSQ